MDSKGRTHLIIGAGVFGTSTALHLIESDPSATVTLLDQTPFPCPLAASHDINKIIRADYGDAFYSKLALEAQELWRDDPLYKPYYHESGIIKIDDAGLSHQMVDNYRNLGVEFTAGIMTPENARTQFDGLYRDGDWRDVKEVFWNPQSGWADAKAALTSTIEAAIDRGVEYVEATVSSLLFDQGGDCIGVQTENGRNLMADHVILCTGAQTAKLLADSAPHRKKLQADGRMLAAGVVTAVVRLTPEQKGKFGVGPVFIQGMEHILGEVLPPTHDGVLKFCRDVTFTNKLYHAESNQTISAPPSRASQRTWGQDVPSSLKQEIFDVMVKIFGNEVKGFEFESYRMCWDAITPNQDWIISPHPHCQRLYVATAGSFHGWKFLPTVGRYVVQMLQGNLDEEKARRWSWDRENKGGAHPGGWPHRDLKDC